MKGLYSSDDVRNRAKLRREPFFRPVELDGLANERINDRFSQKCSLSNDLEQLSRFSSGGSCLSVCDVRRLGWDAVS